jgi:hypothetical protein
LKRKTIATVLLIGILLVVISAALFMVMRRASYAMHGGDGTTPGGLKAVSPDGSPVSLPAGSAKLPENTAMQTVGGMSVSLALSPYPPSGFQAASFDVTLKDENGQAIPDAAVSLDLTMPAMPMPDNQPEAKYTDQGVYHADGRFTMRGLWRIEVIIQRGGQKQSAFFDVGL